MNTKKIDNGSTPKGGKDNTRVVLTAAGAVAVGTGAVLGASSLIDGEEEIPVDDKEKEEQEEENQNQEQENQNQEANNAAQQQQAQQAQHQQTQQTQSNNSTGPTPIATDNPNGGQTTNTGGQTTNTGGGNNEDDVNAEALAVAEHILETDDIDPDDIDDLVDITFQDTDVLYTEGGDEIPVAAVTTPDGGEYLLADVDGDRVYDMVYDMDGNLVAGVEAGLNTNDAQLALDENGGYIPISDDDPVLQDDGLDEDIIALGDDNGSSSVMEEIEDDEDIDDLFEDEPDEEVAETFEPATGLDLEEDTDLESDLLDA